MDLVLNLEVIKGKEIGWPRGENDEYIFTAGNARPLGQATQHASSEMLRWLQSDYGLDASEANFLLGMHVEYDVGNIYDPAFTMVCKLSYRVAKPVSARWSRCAVLESADGFCIVVVGADRAKTLVIPKVPSPATVGIARERL